MHFQKRDTPGYKLEIIKNIAQINKISDTHTAIKHHSLHKAQHSKQLRKEEVSLKAGIPKRLPT